MFAIKELSINIEKKNITKTFNQWVGLGYRLNQNHYLDHPVLLDNYSSGTCYYREEKK
jgi:hypothetical protein